MKPVKLLLRTSLCQSISLAEKSPSPVTPWSWGLSWKPVWAGLVASRAGSPGPTHAVWAQRWFSRWCVLLLRTFGSSCYQVFWPHGKMGWASIALFTEVFIPGGPNLLGQHPSPPPVRPVTGRGPLGLAYSSLPWGCPELCVPED